MKKSHAVAVIAAFILVGAGSAVAVDAATTTPPIKLCKASKGGTVSAPGSSGACPKKTTAFYVASSADVQALAARLDAAETANADQADRIADLEAAVEDLQNGTEEPPGQTLSITGTYNMNGTFDAHISSTGLANQKVTLLRNLETSVRSTIDFPTLAADGTAVVRNLPCSDLVVGAEAVDEAGDDLIKAMLLTVQGCGIEGPEGPTGPTG
ncbi:hypothetical protein [Aeromicrobium sp. NPDC092404]|uniref:hypothetical protein n=1 Tax=Aeromicrobium sp. NPDC092404 TaxID=3154976 RepID=UPI0034131CB3